MASSPPSFVDSTSQHLAYSRKQKSLGLLCSNFVTLYNRADVESIGLDDAARRLGVERRRIYDIVNVLESVGVLARKAKNRYSWIGFSGIPKALQELKDDAVREINSCNAQDQCVKLSDDEEDEPFSQSVDLESEKASTVVDASSSGRTKLDQRKEKSLGLLTQNFVKLFLTTDLDTISLDEAAKILLGDGHDSSNMRTKVRRLYDIANVLSSMNLIEKTQQTDTRKPAFRWLGTTGKPKTEDGVTIAVAPDPKLAKKRAFGTDISNTDSLKRSKLSSSMDMKPNKVYARSAGDLKECNLMAQRELQGSTKSGFVFGPFQPVEVKRESVGSERNGEGIQDWESLAASLRPQYHNQALSELFAHYVEAWKSWYRQFAQGSSTIPSFSACLQ